MSLEPDLIVDRRRLRRQLTFWRVLAVLVAIVGIISVGLVLRARAPGSSLPHIARIEISGLITGQQQTFDLLKRAEDSGAKAVILRINSGGGTTSGSEALYNAVRRLSAKKPVVAVIESVGASGAYMTAMGADRIVANGSAIVGSIGVIAQIPNVSKLLDNVGVKVEAVRSSPLKAMPNGVEPTSPEARAAMEQTVLDTYRWFRDLVGERRKLEGDALAKVADGRVFTGRQAIDLKLIDAVGEEIDAVAWLESEKGIAKGLRIETYRINTNAGRFPLIGLLAALFLPEEASTALKNAMEAHALDGLVSLWHPSAN
ncbi:MAG: signal peptide peptidase SppA [Proteobacteria bacterium]|nr:signal peptide peptidase SppA [Pseudomonadota bacterium]